MSRHEPILEHRLAPKDQLAGGVSAVLEPGMRAVAVTVDDTIGVAGFVKPGDRVDLIVTLSGAEPEDTISKLVLEYRGVLTIGTEMIRQGKEEEAQPVRVMTLEVTPVEAEKLAFSSTLGKIRLALRDPLNSDKTLTPGADLASVLASNSSGGRRGGGGGGYVVELIQGGELTQVTF